MTEEIKLSQEEREARALVKLLIVGYAVEEVQGQPLKAVQVDQIFSTHVAPALKWRMETLDERKGPLTLMDFAFYTLFQVLGSVVILSLMLEEADKLVPSSEKAKLALRLAGSTFAKKAGNRLELLLD
jgi:hypothetical protein